jgi:Polyketide cyclase / dehydrase and lipid transport
MPRPIAVTLTVSTVAPPTAVWAALEAAPRWPEVLDDLAAARLEPEGVLQAGAVMRSFAKPDADAADMTYRVVAAKRPRHLEIEAEVGNFRSSASYRIEGNRDGSRVTLTAAVEGLRGIDRIIAAFARKRYLGSFKAGVERRLRAMLTLAERIAQEKNAARE